MATQLPLLDSVNDEIAAPARRTDRRTEYLIEEYGLHPEWQWHGFEAIEERPPFRFAKYSGGVYRFAKTSGKYKGRTDYKRPEPGTERTVVLDNKAFLAWVPSWEARHGRCSDCDGTTQEWAGWDHIKGNHYRPCTRCGATGIPPAQGIEARSDETPTAAQPEGREPGPKDAPNE